MTQQDVFKAQILVDEAPMPGGDRRFVTQTIAQLWQQNQRLQAQLGKRGQKQDVNQEYINKEQ